MTDYAYSLIIRFMPRVMMHFYEMPTGLTVTFIESGRKIGRARHYADPDRIYDILRAAKAPSEDIQTVEFALVNRRPGAVALRLSQEQYDKLKRGSNDDAGNLDRVLEDRRNARVR
jgi:hypothetical protein